MKKAIKAASGSATLKIMCIDATQPEPDVNVEVYTRPTLHEALVAIADNTGLIDAGVVDEEMEDEEIIDELVEMFGEGDPEQEVLYFGNETSGINYWGEIHRSDM